MIADVGELAEEIAPGTPNKGASLSCCHRRQSKAKMGPRLEQLEGERAAEIQENPEQEFPSWCQRKKPQAQNQEPYKARQAQAKVRRRNIHPFQKVKGQEIEDLERKGMILISNLPENTKR